MTLKIIDSTHVLCRPERVFLQLKGKFMNNEFNSFSSTKVGRICHRGIPPLQSFCDITEFKYPSTSSPTDL